MTEHLAKIRVERESSRWRDRLRAYKVVVDGSTVGSVADGASAEFNVEPGHHTLRLRIDWCGSPTVEFTVGDGESSDWVCSPNGGAWSAIWRGIVTPSGYVVLVPKS